jgi:cytochrome c
MKTVRTVLLFAAVFGLIFSVAYAAGDAVKGKALFNDTHFAGATSGKSCNSCHPDGRGLQKAGEKHEFKIMGKTQSSLEEAVNVCIEKAIKGKALDPESDDMKNIVAYIKSLKSEMN